MNASILIIAAFAVFALAIGVMARRGRKLTLEQWAVGGRGFGSLLTFLLMAGEAFSTFSFLGASGWTYSKGVPAFYILSYGCLAFVIGYWMLPAVWRYAKARGPCRSPTTSRRSTTAARSACWCRSSRCSRWCRC